MTTVPLFYNYLKELKAEVNSDPKLQEMIQDPEHDVLAQFLKFHDHIDPKSSKSSSAVPLDYLNDKEQIFRNFLMIYNSDN